MRLLIIQHLNAAFRILFQNHKRQKTLQKSAESREVNLLKIIYNFKNSDLNVENHNLDR